MNPDEKTLSEVLSRWDVGLKRVHPDIVIAGSPERSEFRVVVEDLSGRLLIMERIASRTLSRKQRIAEAMAFLRKKGFTAVQPYLHAHDGTVIHEAAGGLWQVVPYVTGVALNRPEYVFDQWRGVAMAETLLELRKSSAGIPFFKDEPVFSLPAYIDQLVSAIQKRRPEVMKDVGGMQAFVKEKLYPVYNELPTGFCHGDYHAINIIWGEKRINALIDWEFLGNKPELYDAANMVSCLGIEDPECLVGPVVLDFIRTLKRSGVYDEQSFERLPALVIAMRFAWVSEWLRKKDDEMLQLEFDYFDLLTKHLAGLQAAWR
jgi:homoserine kinase type II